jgi:hypothetical protein
MDVYLADARARGPKKPKKTGRYGNSDPLIKFLRERTCRLNYGAKVPGKGVLPELKTAKLIERYNGRYGRGRYGASLRNDQFHDHFAARATYYFWADHRAGTAQVLVMIDFDAGEAHGGGTREGCWRFAERVRRQLFPGMYLEPSTHGEGVHGYLVFEKLDTKNDLVRRVLKHLDGYLKKLAASVGADIRAESSQVFD